jgi:hypothetical protein
VTPAAVHGAITAIQRVPPTALAARELRPAWAVLVQTVDRSVRTAGSARDDVRQDALLRVMRNVHACAAATPASAARWVERVVETAAIDAARAARTEPVDIALRGRGAPGRRGVDVDALHGDVTLATDAPDRLVRQIEAALDRHLAATVRHARDRAAHCLHARARLHRKLGASIDGVRRVLAFGHTLSDSLVSKWIERGLAPLDGAVRVWINDDPANRDQIGRTLRAQLCARSAAAGVARAA